MMINLIIPMAGRGTRMRPHTLTTPKPLIPIAGKTILARLVEEIQAATPASIATIGYVVNELPPPSLRAELMRLAAQVGADAQFYVQQAALGTAHAVLCAADLLQGPTIVAFSDTLFRCTASLDLSQENAVWVKQVADPSAFGVVQVTAQHKIIDFVEKPTTLVSDLAIIGIYYFRQGALLREALEQLVAAGLRQGGEYLLTDALQAMMKQGASFFAHPVDEWFDCGNKEATLHTNQRLLTLLQGKEVLVAPSAQLHNSIIIPPVFLGEHVQLENAVIGPYVTIGSHSSVSDARIQNSLVQHHSTIKEVTLKDSMIGNRVQFTGHSSVVNVGDYTKVG